MIRQIVLTFLLILYFISAIAQGTWRNFNDTSGLYSNRGREIEADKFGNIWVSLGSGTLGDGLSQFDGTSWTHFDTSNSSIPQNAIGVLRSDSNGILWMGFQGGTTAYLNGLTRFDGQTWTSFDTLNSGIISNAIWDIQVDKNNHIWIGCIGGFSKFDGTSFTNYFFDFGGGQGFIIQDSANFWIASNGLVHYNPLTDSTTVYDLSNSNIPSYSVSCISQDSDGIIWLGFDFAFNGGIGVGGTNGGLATFDGNVFTPIWPFSSVYTGVKNMVIDRSDNVWLSTWCDGLFNFDGSAWTQEPGIPNNGCSTGITTDYQDNVWYTDLYSGVWTNSPTIGISEMDASNGLNLFPNPASNKITINSEQSSINKYKIYSILGVMIKKQEKLHTNKLSLSIENYSNGLYFLHIETEEGKTFVKRFIKN